MRSTLVSKLPEHISQSTENINNKYIEANVWSVPLRQKTHQNSIQNDARIHQIPSQIHPKSTKVVPKSAPKPALEADRQRVIRGRVFTTSFWYRLGDFGRHLGPSWAPRGGPKSHFCRPPSFFGSDFCADSENDIHFFRNSILGWFFHFYYFL